MENGEFFSKIENKDILSERPVPEDGTRIIVQRHGKYDRDRNSESSGKLTHEGEEKTKQESRERVKNILDKIPEDERSKVMFLILGSDTTYNGKGARSMETAQIILDQIKEELKERGLNETQILNVVQEYRKAKEGGVRPVPLAREPLMIENSSEFLQFLKEKYGDMNFDFWFAFETDADREKRLEMGAEGVEDLADRLNKFLLVLNRYSSFFHKKHPDKRLVVWTASHYDLISPWSRKFILGQKVEDFPMPVDYGAGVSIDTNKDGESSTMIGNKEYGVKL